jgi:hypothetical protein
MVLPQMTQATALGFLENIGASLRTFCHRRRESHKAADRALASTGPMLFPFTIEPGELDVVPTIIEPELMLCTIIIQPPRELKSTGSPSRGQGRWHQGVHVLRHTFCSDLAMPQSAGADD